MSLTLWLSLLLALSVLGNVFLIWYLSRLLRRFVFISENLSDLTSLVGNYAKHLKKVYEMEMFYGEPVLQHLIAHTKDLTEILKDYEDVYSIALPLEELNKEQDFDETSEEASEETTEEEDSQPKDVLYAGSRRRDN